MLWSQFVVFSAVIFAVFARNLTPEQTEQLDTFVKTIIACRNNVGISLALVREGDVIYTNGFGYRDNDMGTPVDDETLINIGSLTKAFTASLGANAVAGGLLDWDTPLQDYLGEDFRLQGDFRSQQVTTRDLMSHKLGLPNYWGLSTAFMNITREELCMERLQYFPVEYNFRSKYLYANYPWVLAGWLLQNVTGVTWEQYIYDVLFNPLSMTHTRIGETLQEQDWNNLAYSYTYEKEVYSVNPEKDQLPFLNAIGPAAGVWSSARDMGVWMNFILSGGQDKHGSQIVPEAQMTETYQVNFATGRETPKVQKPRFPVDDAMFTYALGWRNGIYKEREKLYHTGSYSCYDCRLTLLPDEQVGVWACVNSPGDNRGSRAVHVVNTYALDLLLDDEPWLNDTTGCTYPEPWLSSPLTFDDLYDDDDANNIPPLRGSPGLSDPQMPQVQLNQGLAEDLYVEVSTSRPRPLSDYVGNYTNPAFGTFEVYFNETGQMRYRFATFLKGDVTPAGTENNFYMTIEYPLSYRMVFFPEFPNGFPLDFYPDEQDVDIVQVKVPYLEDDFPPFFSK